MIVGFSTGALAFSDFRRGVALNQMAASNAVELSALRESEVPELLAALGDLPLSEFQYISFHAPSSLQRCTERELITHLHPILERGWPIIVHPDLISDFDLWANLGHRILIENMDQRKPVGRNLQELRTLFSRLPEAKLCFDICHARQIDPTMSIAVGILTEFGDRLAELHISEVDSGSRHVSVSRMAQKSFQRVSCLIPEETPVIIESTVGEDEIAREITTVRACLRRVTIVANV